MLQSIHTSVPGLLAQNSAFRGNCYRNCNCNRVIIQSGIVNAMLQVQATAVPSEVAMLP